MSPTTTSAVAMPLGLAALPPDHEACASCGVAVPTLGAPLVKLRVLAREMRMPGGFELVEAAGTMSFAECAACTDRHALVAAVVVAHPGLAHLGSTSITADRLSLAVDALAAVDVLTTPRQVRKATETYTTAYAAATSLLDRFSILGGSVQFSARFSPVWKHGADPATCASSPWLHVEAGLAQDIRYQLGEHLRDRMPPRPIPAPADSRYSGCVICGVASVEARRPELAWTGVPSGAYAGGHLCASCAGAVDFTGGTLGPSAVEQAVLEVVDPDRAMRRKRPNDPQLHGLSMWADAGDLPAPTRFAFLNTDALVELLTFGDW